MTSPHQDSLERISERYVLQMSDSMKWAMKRAKELETIVAQSSVWAAAEGVDAAEHLNRLLEADRWDTPMPNYHSSH